MSHFSIHLSEPLSDSEAKRVALLTAPALGGSPEKLQLLLSRQAGSRIARASNQNQANTVANILRSAGVKVDVLENAAENEPQVPPAAVPPVLNAPDPFAAPSIPPLNAQGSDPFAAPKPDPFAAPKSDPFAAPKSDPFAAPKSDPFAAPKSDPFAAPKSDPFAAPKSDPFAAPNMARGNSENTQNADPFAAPGTAVGFDRKEIVQSDLPPQARKARDRAMPRTSVRNQMLASLIVPYVLVALGTIAFMAYQLPQIYREQLGLRAYQAALGLAKANFGLVEQLPSPTALKELEAEAKNNLTQTLETTAIIYAAKVLAISGTNGELAAFASTINMTAEEAVEIDNEFKKFEAQGLKFGAVLFRGQPYIGSVAEIKDNTLATSEDTVIGEVHIVFSLAEIPTRVVQAIIPLLIALAVIFVFALFLANALAARLSRPIISATDQANRIALGDLDRTVTVESNDEIGDMLGSLERMRVSLKSMVARMRRNT